MKCVYIILVQGADTFSDGQSDWTYGIYSTYENAKEALDEIVQKSQDSPEPLDYEGENVAFYEGEWDWVTYTIKEIQLDTKIY